MIFLAAFFEKGRDFACGGWTMLRFPREKDQSTQRS